MCGIVGYTGGRNIKEILIEGLKRLEYRGYDSAGMAFVENQEIRLFKKKGKVIGLESKILKETIVSRAGIAHTRWATHGEPTDINSHPHTDESKTIAVVHNGIIENYRELKKYLIDKGHVFVSETDTEVLPHLFEEFYQGDLREAVWKGLKLVEGAYGICVIHKDHPELIVGARKGSPLILGIGEKENFLVSDASAIVSYTRNVVFLEDGDMAVITPDSFKTYEMDNQNEIDKKIEEISWDIENIEKSGFDHFMLKEIYEQPATIRDSFRGRIILNENKVKLGGIQLAAAEIRDLERINFIACGTSWHASIFGKYLIENLVKTISTSEYASEFRYREPVVLKNDLFFTVSQSGETADTLAAIKLIHEKGGKVFGITNVVGSSIARATDGGVYTHAGIEVGVASTKAFTAQLTVILLISVLFARTKNTIREEEAKAIIDALVLLPETIEKYLKNINQIKDIAEKYKDSKHALYLGRGLNFPIALEGALKLKEISYIHAEGYPAAEMKHGPIALIDDNMPCFVIATKDSIYEKVISNIKEIKARKGKVIAIASEGDREIKELVDDLIFVPVSHLVVQPILNTIPLQLIAYYIASAKGLDVDKPRNLAKSVTVE
ncbi:MAG: glutamine--fructose-6-phosphate aminotransferase [Spirochaetes bacterium GWB1_36_13]|nr:MAG: glutamine--fructose-6-phosphate aminotransferase [Spirochaetes bacterium GWB1_36_13]